MDYNAFKELSVKKFKEFVKENKIGKDLVKAFKKEVLMAERYYIDGKDLYQEFLDNKDKLDTKYILPYILGFTNELLWDKPEVVQISDINGAPDYDADFAPSGRTKIKEYLEQKYGVERCVPVGTYSTLGCASAAKDLLRVYNIDFKKSNEFTTSLDATLSWEENLENLKNNIPQMYQFYKDNEFTADGKPLLKLVPEFIDKVRSNSIHAGGICILDEPIYKRTPVDRVNGQMVTAYQESGSKMILDEEKIIKLDLLVVSILDVIKHTVEKIEEDLYLIEDNDGIKKIVPASYIEKEIARI